VALALYPYFLLVFWYHEFLPRSVKKSFEVFVYSLELLSVPLLIITFLKPLKGEYRDGLVVFSIIMGIVVKTFILLVDFAILSVLVLLLLVVNLMIAILPFLLVEFIFLNKIWFSR
jgi:hypothetical protein